MAATHARGSIPEAVLSVYARHVVKLFLNLLSIHFGLRLALLVALHPWPEPHLYDRDPDYVAAVVDVAVELVDLVEHFLVILLGHPHVFLDHLNLFLAGLDLNVVDLIVELSLLVFLKLDHLRLSHLLLDLVDHFHVELALKVLFAEHGDDILEVVLLEAVICWDLEMGNEQLSVLGVAH